MSSDKLVDKHLAYGRSSTIHVRSWNDEKRSLSLARALQQKGVIIILGLFGKWILIGAVGWRCCLVCQARNILIRQLLKLAIIEMFGKKLFVDCWLFIREKVYQKPKANVKSYYE